MCIWITIVIVVALDLYLETAILVSGEERLSTDGIVKKEKKSSGCEEQRRQSKGNMPRGKSALSQDF